MIKFSSLEGFKALLLALKGWMLATPTPPIKGDLADGQTGATAVEYGLIAALIAVAAITAMSQLGSKIDKTFNSVSSNLRPEATLRLSDESIAALDSSALAVRFGIGEGCGTDADCRRDALDRLGLGTAN